MFEGNGNKVKECIDEGVVHVCDVVALFEGHAMGDLDVGMIVSVGGPTVFGNIGDFRGKCIVGIGVCLAAGIVPVEGGIDGNVQEIHLFGYRGLVGLGTFTHILEEIVEDKEVGGAQTWLRWCWEGKAHSGNRGFCIGR